MNKFVVLIVLGVSGNKDYPINNTAELSHSKNLKDFFVEKNLIWEYNLYKSFKKVITEDLNIYGKNEQVSYGSVFSDSREIPYVIHFSKIFEGLLRLDDNTNKEICFIVPPSQYEILKNNFVFQNIFVVNTITPENMVHRYM
ncbi:MAG: hypothetical protein WCQ32_00905 [bacterium]